MKIRLIRSAKPIKAPQEHGLTAKLKMLRVGDALIIDWDREKHPSLNTTARTLARRLGIGISALAHEGVLQLRRTR